MRSLEPFATGADWKGKARQGAKRPCGFETTDYRLLTFDPDPGIDVRESVVHRPWSVVSLRFSLSPQYSFLVT